MIKLDVTNTNKVIDSIEKYGEDAVKEIKSVTKITAQEVEDEAKSLAPIDKGTLRQSIRAEQQEAPLTYKVTAYMPYSAYHEFGTGGLVNIPKGWGEMASRFKGKGIKQVNIKARPFMYPAYLKGKMIFSKNIKDALKHLNKKFNNG